MSPNAFACKQEPPFQLSASSSFCSVYVKRAKWSSSSFLVFVLFFFCPLMVIDHCTVTVIRESLRFALSPAFFSRKCSLFSCVALSVALPPFLFVLEKKMKSREVVAEVELYCTTIYYSLVKMPKSKKYECAH